MNPRPVIFISAVSKELKTARGLAARLLHSMGYDPKDEDMARTEHGSLRGVLRRWIDQSEGVIQLVGKCHGAEPREPDSEFGRCSYTEFEALYALQTGKPVWYFFVADDYQTDAHEPEPADIAALQQDYIARIHAGGDLRHRFATDAELEVCIRRIEDHLDELRRAWHDEQRRARRFRVFAGIGLLLLLALGIASVQLGWWVKKNTAALTNDTAEIRANTAETKDTADRTEKKVDVVIEHNRQMEQALVRLAAVEMRVRQPGENLTPAQLRDRAYGILERDLGLPVGSLAKSLPAFALELYSRLGTTLLMRAHAAYALNKFDEAKKLFLESAAQERKVMENAQAVTSQSRDGLIQALTGAGDAALALVQYGEALEHYRAAADLTDEQRAPLEWAGVQFSIAAVMHADGKFPQAEAIYRRLSSIYQGECGAEHADTLASRNNLATVLYARGKSAEAEKEHRAVLAIRERVLGAEHPDTLGSRNNLAVILNEQRKSAKAEKEHRAVLAIRKRVQGPEHPDTLTSRNNLAAALSAQDKHDEAVAELRAVLAIRERVQGPEDLGTLNSRNNLGAALAAQGKHAEAEVEHRAVLEVRKRVLGAEHPATLSSRNNLACALDQLGKSDEAEVEHRAVLAIRERDLGEEHLDTLGSRINLAEALRAQEKNAEAEAEFRKVLAVRERMLGAEDPATLVSRNNLAEALAAQEKYAKAEVEFRKVLAIRERDLGAEHSDTLNSRRNLALVLAAQGKHADAVAELRAVLAVRQRVQGAEDPGTMLSWNEMASALFAQGKYAEAEAEFRAVLAIMERVLPAGHLDVARSCFNLALCLVKQNKLQDAPAFLRRAEGIWGKALGPEHPNTMNAKAARLVVEADLTIKAKKKKGGGR